MEQEVQQKDAKAFGRWGVFLFLVLIVLDQLAKHLAKRIFYNSAFAFSLPVPVALIYVIYSAVLIGIIYYVFKHHRGFNLHTHTAWLLILAGAFSNVGERIILGSVRDFIFITLSKWTGVYNLADFYIIIGILILLFIKPSTSFPASDKGERKLHE